MVGARGKGDGIVKAVPNTERGLYGKQGQFFVLYLSITIPL